MLAIYDLETEYRSDPIGIDETHPAFSWKLRSTENDTTQKSYRITVTKGGELQWDTGVVETDRSLYIPYEGRALLPRSRYAVKVEITDRRGEQAGAEGFFETGLMTWENFRAGWITHGFEDDLEPCAVFVKKFSAGKKVARARAYVSALGLYEIKLNGGRVGDARFAPGWTSYQRRLQYQTYDITNQIRENNLLEITVANGWYKGILGFYGQGDHYGPRTALIAQFEITYADGTVEEILTDETWISTTAHRRYSEIYHGEVIDYSLPAQPEVPARLYDYPKDILVAQVNDPVRITQRVSAKSLIISPKGERIIDFGQNLTGVVEARLRCPKNTKITVAHAEALDENGNFFTTNLRTARATDTFVCSGGEDVFLPEFTYHGFRYIRIEGLEDIDISRFTACVLHTDCKRTGTFSCSSEDINQLWRNIDWTMRSNFLDIPMDCPQRDERLGYTGDTEIFLPTAVFHRNLALFFRKWLRDLRVEQTDAFGVPLSVPDILRTNACVSIWHEAATIVPWVLWQTYGDRRVLEEQYDSMRRSVAYTRRLAGERGILQSDNSSQFGDWVAIDAPRGPFRKPPEGIMYPSMDERAGGTDPHLIGNVYYLYSIDILAKTAAVLGYADDEREYRALYGDVLAKFRAEYITPAGRIVSDTQTAAALMLYFDLLEEKDRQRAADRLALNLVKTKKHLRTGFVGTQYITHALSQNGLHRLAGDILFKDDCPSWLYSIRLGATTIWELWDGVNPDGSFNLFEMNSLNQFGFASIGDWLVKELCGITATAPGYKKSRVAPNLVRGITSVRAEYETVYGLISCSFSCEKGRIRADIHIPENTTSVIALPEREEIAVGSGDYHFEYATQLIFEPERYSMDSTLNSLIEQPAAAKMFMDEMPELARSGFIRAFAGGLSIEEIEKTLPRSMVPEAALDLFKRMIRELNRLEREGEQNVGHE